MLVMAKFKVMSVTLDGYTRYSKTGPDRRERGSVKLSAVTGQPGDLPENIRFHEATPGGTIEILVDNPDAFAAFKAQLGDELYVQFSDSRPWTEQEKAEEQAASPT